MVLNKNKGELMELERDHKVVLYTIDVLQSLVKKGILPKEIWKKEVTVNSRKTKRVLKKFNITPEEIHLCLGKLIVEGFLSQETMEAYAKSFPDSFINQLEMEIN
mgnify:CR=1 FL=1|tara:strand:- start:30 stop:344 length:315 start_codon:yes stop_codon:yes gene_type:complete